MKPIAEPYLGSSAQRCAAAILAVAMLGAGALGCTATYPADAVEQSIIRLCQQEYKIDVKVATVGQTIAIYLPLTNLLDFTFTVTPEASDRINNVLLCATRVVISTNAQFNFYCVIAHDTRLPEIQIVIIKSVDDVKRFLLSDVSRSEYSKRMLIDLRLSPQAKKEKVIKDIFERMNLDKEWQEELLNDFFRTEPAALGEIGYWNDRFFIKDITISEFIAEQIASRVKIEFKDIPELSEAFLVKSSDGKYMSDQGERFFTLEVLAVNRKFDEIDRDVSSDVFKMGLLVAANVVHAYKFEDFNYIDIVNVRDYKHLKVSRETLEAYRLKEMTFDEVAQHNLSL